MAEINIYAIFSKGGFLFEDLSGHTAKKGGEGDQLRL